MSGGQITLLIVVAAVVLLVTIVVIAGRRRGPESSVGTASRAAESTEDLIASMQQMHLRMHQLVVEGRLGEARQFARSLRNLTRRDPDHWVGDVVERVRTDQDAPSPDFTSIRERLAFGSTTGAVEEYRRITGANQHEAERVVAAMTAAHRLRS